MRTRDLFVTVHTEGGLLPTDLLQRILQNHNELPGLKPTDYHLASGEKINEAISRAWNRLLRLWEAFRAAAEKLPQHDTGTTLTREQWLLPLFHELGYGRLQTTHPIEIGERSYPISHRYNHTPIHLVGCNIPLDRPTPGIRGAARSSPHNLVQELLNRSEDYLWAFLSNGLLLRILRDNKSLTRQAYLQFDLQAIMNGELYADFALLWLLCHASRVTAEKPEQCWLEQWARSAQEQGVRALDQLRTGVTTAIETLARGFLRHPANRELRDKLRNGTLTTHHFYHQVLRIIYRILFLLVAEARDLLLTPEADPEARERYLLHYSLTRLRRMAQRFRGSHHHDLYLALQIVFKHLYAGCPPLALPALGSFLFHPEATSELNNARVTNNDLLEAIRALSFIEFEGTRRLIDYGNLRTEELGSVYEALLEMHPELNTDAATFSLITASGNERKTTGSYYTPDSLVQSLLDTALEPVLQQTLQKASRQSNPEQALLNLKICDPACGSGHFLIAAAHRIAKHLASLRTGEPEPAPEPIRNALREVIGRCLYGVDINPMAVELCKIALWIEALVPGKPLSFLDHHIRCGNSLLGATPPLLHNGLPDEAFEPNEGDDKALCNEAKKRNRKEREGQGALFDPNLQPWEQLGNLPEALAHIEHTPDDTLEGVQERERRYTALVHSTPYENARLLADAWCAAFFWHKTRHNPHYPPTTALLQRILRNPHDIDPAMRHEIQRIAAQHRFFHWHLEFPDVFGADNPNPGFHVVLGNPPWEKVELQEKEWFATHHPAIAGARNAAERKRRIKALQNEDPALHAAWCEALRQSEATGQFLRFSGRYPLCGKGKINTYAVFAELFRTLLVPAGRTGIIVPTGIATDDTTKDFFAHLIDTGALVSLYDFENRRTFPGVHASYKFCLLTLQGPGMPPATAQVAFYAHTIDDLRDPERCFPITAEEIALLNPNTRTCPTFRTRRDAAITEAIYRRVPVFLHEGAENGNPWEVFFEQGLFNMASDSHLFHTDPGEANGSA